MVCIAVGLVDGVSEGLGEVKAAAEEIREGPSLGDGCFEGIIVSGTVVEFDEGSCDSKTVGVIEFERDDVVLVSDVLSEDDC